MSSSSSSSSSSSKRKLTSLLCQREACKSPNLLDMGLVLPDDETQPGLLFCAQCGQLQGTFPLYSNKKPKDINDLTMDTICADSTDTASVVLYHIDASTKKPYILCHLRASTKRTYSLHVSCPGGHCEGKESFWKAACRETLEEAGIDIKDCKSKATILRFFMNANKRRHMTIVIQVDPSTPSVLPTTPDEMDASFSIFPNRHRWIYVDDLINEQIKNSDWLFVAWRVHPAFLEDVDAFKQFIKHTNN